MTPSEYAIQKRRERQRQYYRDHREERLAYRRQYYQDHREQIREYQRRYQAGVRAGLIGRGEEKEER